MIKKSNLKNKNRSINVDTIVLQNTLKSIIERESKNDSEWAKGRVSAFEIILEILKDEEKTSTQNIVKK